MFFSLNVAPYKRAFLRGFICDPIDNIVTEVKVVGIVQCDFFQSAVLIDDFTDPVFQDAFMEYFSEIGIAAYDRDGLFREMNDGMNEAYMRLDEGGNCVGFIQFCPITFTSWFFEGTCGFIREFRVSPERRGEGHGTSLLRLTEGRFREKGYGAAVLTTDSAEDFYLARGYKKAPGIRAKNGDRVFVKQL